MQTKKTIVFFDLETTGFCNPRKITQIGALAVDQDFNTIVSYNHYVNPQRNIEPEAREITGLTEEFLQSYPPFAEVAPSFVAFIQNLPHTVYLVAHSGSDFDFPIVRQEFASCAEAGVVVRPQWVEIDTIDVLKQMDKELQGRFGASYKLDTLCQRFGIPVRPGRHDALEDAEILKELCLKIQDYFIKFLDNAVASETNQ